MRWVRGVQMERWGSGSAWVGMGGTAGIAMLSAREEFWVSDGDVTGITSDGGYAEYMIARAEAVAMIPEELSPEEAAPLMCAGSRTFNVLAE